MANIPVITVLFSLSWVVGMVIFASYANCDPLSLGYISKIDEIVPFYVEDKFVFLPGLLGLFMATLFNGALRYVLQIIIKGVKVIPHLLLVNILLFPLLTFTYCRHKFKITLCMIILLFSLYPTKFCSVMFW